MVESTLGERCALVYILAQDFWARSAATHREEPRPCEAVAKAPVAILVVIAFVTPERL